MAHDLSRSCKSPVAIGAAGVALAVVFTPLVITTPGFAAPVSDIVINEVIQNHPSIPDTVELMNTSGAPVDVTGWILADDKDRDPALTIGAGSVIAPGSLLAIEVDIESDAGFGLGRADQARLLRPDRAQVDSFAWTDHSATSYGRNPDGTGEFAVTRSATPGAPNEFAAPGQDTIVINEVESSEGTPGDWVELLNTGSEAVDVTGWVLRDDKDANGFVIPGGRTIAAGEYLVLDETEFGFGLGGADQARLFLPDGTTLVNETSWGAHAANTWGRCPNGIGAFAETQAATKGAANDCADVVIPSVVINEIESNGGDPGDWVELVNTGTTPVDIGGWIITDSDPLHVASFPGGTVIEPGDFVLMEEAQLGYGLGKADSARLLLSDGITVVDENSWTEHAPTSIGRCPDGTGPLQITTATTKGAANDCSAPVRINEIESSGDAAGDWVELVNVGFEAVDVSGMSLRDSGAGNDALVVPAGTSIAADGYLQLHTEPTFGLGGADAVQLFDVDGATMLDETSWSEHAAVTWGRCPDGTGAFTDTRTATPGASNACAGDLITTAWPGSPDVVTADVANTFGADMSGVTFDPASVPGAAYAWAVNNGNGTLHRLSVADDSVREVAGWESGKRLRYPDGTGTVDAEAVALAADPAAVFVGSERNTGAGGAGSRPSVLQFSTDAAAGDLIAVQEWNLAADYPGIGANAGIEGLAWVPDAVLTGAGMSDLSTGSSYDPAQYGPHNNGVFFVGVEATNVVAGYVLESDGSFTRVTEFATGFPGIMELEYESSNGQLWAYCDEACDGRSQMFTLVGGAFSAGDVVDRPAGMANIANEGLAFAPAALCVNDTKPALWADDAQTAGHAFRIGGVECAVAGGGGDNTAAASSAADGTSGAAGGASGAADGASSAGAANGGAADAAGSTTNGAGASAGAHDAGAKNLANTGSAGVAALVTSAMLLAFVGLVLLSRKRQGRA